MRMKIAASIAAVSLWLLASVAPATASITYDYKQKWAYDSTSGLYWQVLPTPTATFVPPRGTIADDTQVNQLIVDAGITSQPFALVEPGTQAFYEPALGDLLSFFALDKPAQNPPTLRANYSASVIWDQPADYNPPLDHYQYWSFSYQPASPNVLRWTYSSSITLGPYGPDTPCPTFPDFCPSTELAFVVSTTAPVPVPAGWWLLISGLALGGAAISPCRSFQTSAAIRRRC